MCAEQLTEVWHLYSKMSWWSPGCHSTVQSMWEGITVLRCVTPSIDVYPDRCYSAGQIESHLQQNERVTGDIRVIPIGTIAASGRWYVKNVMDVFSSQGDRGCWLESPLWDGTLHLTAQISSQVRGRHLILIHALHSSQLIDVSTGADNLRLTYTVWLWKYLNEVFITSTFLI